MSARSRLKTRASLPALFAVLMLGIMLAGRASLVRADTVMTSVSVGASPRVVAVSPDGSKVYVSNRLSNDVSVISAANDTLIATIPAGLGPGAIHVGSDGRVYVPDREGNALTVIDPASNAVIRTVPTGLRPAAIDTSPDNNRVLVANERAGSVTILDHSLSEIATLDVGRATHTVVVSPDGARAYVADELANTVFVMDIASPAPSVVTGIPVGLAPGSLQFVGSNRLFVANQSSGDISIIDTTANTVVNTVRVGDSPHGLAETPDASRVLVANEASGTVTALSAEGAVLATIPVGANPQRIHITADGARAYVPNEGSDSVSVIDTATLTVVETLSVGSAPVSLAIGAGDKVYVANSRSNSITVIARSDQPSAPPRAGATTVPVSTPSAGQVHPTSRSTVGLTPKQTAAATARATPTRPASVLGGKTKPGRSGGPVSNTTPDPAGGAPSWIWLAAALGVLAALSVAGYFARDRLAPQAQRLIDRITNRREGRTGT